MTAARRPKRNLTGRLIGLAMELPPAAYVALTGEAPAWVRIWFVTWLALWLAITVVVATKAQAEQQTARAAR